MCCGFNRVTINFNGYRSFAPYIPIGGTPMMCGYNWGMPMNMTSVFGAAIGFGLSGLAMRGIASLFGK